MLTIQVDFSLINLHLRSIHLANVFLHHTILCLFFELPLKIFFFQVFCIFSYNHTGEMNEYMVSRVCKANIVSIEWRTSASSPQQIFREIETQMPTVDKRWCCFFLKMLRCILYFIAHDNTKKKRETNDLYIIYTDVRQKFTVRYLNTKTKKREWK